jgi:hypothetical protein
MTDRRIENLQTDSEVVTAMVLAHNAVVDPTVAPGDKEIERYIANFEKVYRAIASVREEVPVTTRRP